MEYKRVVLVLGMLSALAGMPVISFAHDEAAHHHHHMMMMDKKGHTQAVVSYKTPDVKLVDADDRTVSLRALLDGPAPVMLNFIFTTCTTVCPVMSATFAKVQDKLGPVRLVSISIDPENDTPARLKTYAGEFSAGPQWSMLTGSIQDSIAVQRAFDIYRGDKMNHEPVTFMRKGPDQPWVRINGFISPADLVHEYNMLASKE